MSGPGQCCRVEQGANRPCPLLPREGPSSASHRNDAMCQKATCVEGRGQSEKLNRATATFIFVEQPRHLYLWWQRGLSLTTAQRSLAAYRA